MRRLRVGRRVTSVLSVAVLCLFSPAYRLVRSERANPFPLEGRGSSPGAVNDIYKCDKPESNVSVTVEGEGTVFQFECPAASKLHPVEQVQLLEEALPEKELQKVSVFIPSSRLSPPACTESDHTLSQLVPKSTLEEVKQQEDKLNYQQQEQTGGRVFKLTLGSEPDATRHLCYTCVTPGAGKVRSGDTKCNVYVTVPAKQNPPQTPPAGDETDKPSGSGSFSPPVFGWLIVGVTGCVTAMVSHL